MVNNNRKYSEKQTYINPLEDAFGRTKTMTSLHPFGIQFTEHSNFAAKTENKAAINELSVSTYLSMPRTKANLARGDFDEIFKIIWIY